MTKMIGLTVRLSSVEKRLCEHVTKVRIKTNRSNNVSEKKISKDEELQLELEGYGAELAFCRLFNVFPDTSTHSRSSESDTGDAFLPCGRAVDVKATKYPNGKLLAALWKKDEVDLYALMVGQYPEYTFMGFMRKDELRREERVGSLGHGPTYIANQNELKELSELQNESRFNTRAADCYLQPASNQ